MFTNLKELASLAAAESNLEVDYDMSGPRQDAHAEWELRLEGIQPAREDEGTRVQHCEAQTGWPIRIRGAIPAAY